MSENTVIDGRVTSHSSNNRWMPMVGWNVQYNYDCPCGLTHYTDAVAVWPNGDVRVHVVKAKCPSTDKDVEVALTRKF